MTYTDMIRSALGAAPDGLTLQEIAHSCRHEVSKVSGLLGALRKTGAIMRDGEHWKLATACQEPAQDAAEATDDPEKSPPEPVEAASEAPVARFWVYSDRTIGIGLGAESIELSQAQLTELIDFLAGVRPLLDRVPA